MHLPCKPLYISIKNKNRIVVFLLLPVHSGDHGNRTRTGLSRSYFPSKCSNTTICLVSNITYQIVKDQVDWEALESSSPRFQRGATPSQLPVHFGRIPIPLDGLLTAERVSSLGFLGKRKARDSNPHPPYGGISLAN